MMIDSASIAQLSDRDVYDASGSRIGSAAEVYLDDTTGLPEWLTVRTGLFGTQESFVPVRDAELTADGLRVPVSKDVVKDAPRVEPDGHLSPAEERKLYRYYGVEPNPAVEARAPRTVTEPAHPVLGIPREGTEVPWPETAPERAVATGDQVAGPLDPPEAQRNVASDPADKPLLRRYDG